MTNHSPRIAAPRRSPSPCIRSPCIRTSSSAMPGRAAWRTRFPASACIPCAPPRRRMPYPTTPTLPRCSSGWGTVIFPRRACMINGSSGLRTARRLRFGIKVTFPLCGFREHWCKFPMGGAERWTRSLILTDGVLSS